MYRALYRKWRPQKFEDVIGQADIVTALENQLLYGHIGHAYLFTGTRGTGKTTCAKIFAKAVNCPHRDGAEPCGKCSVCTGIDEGRISDVEEIDAASNNGVEDIRNLRGETVYAPAAGAYKVYIIDEVHMLSSSAFGALLKIMEEPPPHVIFILATTEVHKVPATIRSRCQRYDFMRISPDDIAKRLLYVARQEQIALTADAAQLIARLADGAMRDALSILDTCAGVTSDVDEALVRRMAGVTDRGYLFDLSQAIAEKDTAKALQLVAELRERSIDLKRLCDEMILHYRNLMIAGMPGGARLLSGVSAEEEQRYAGAASAIPRRDTLRAIRVLCRALDQMGKGTDARIELELALLGLCEDAPAAAPAAFAAAAPAQAAPPRAAAPTEYAVMPGKAAQGQGNAPAPQQTGAAAPQQTGTAAPRQTGTAAPPSPAAQAKSASSAPSGAAAGDAQTAGPADPAAVQTPPPFAAWGAVVEAMAKRDQLLYAYMKEANAYLDTNHPQSLRILIGGSDLFLTYMHKNQTSAQLLKQVIFEVTGQRYAIGPWPPKTERRPETQTAEETLNRLAAQGVEVVYKDNRKNET